MSGAEAVVVLGLLGNIITIIQAVEQVSKAFTSSTGLPKNFKETAAKLPFISVLLGDAKRYIEAINDSRKAALKPIFERCQSRAVHLQQLFTSVEREDGDTKFDRYWKAARTIGKGGRVEDLMRGILEDLQLMLTRFPEITTTQSKEELAKAIDEVSKMEPSLPAFFDEGGSFYHSGSGAQNNNLAGGVQNINTGTGNQNNGPGYQYIGTNHIGTPAPK